MTDPDKKELASPEAAFQLALERFDDALELAKRISLGANGRYVKTRFGWASYLFTRQCSLGASLAQCVRPTPHRYALDHTVAFTLSRSILEAAFMFFYLAERGITDEQWELRRTVLWLHDATSRYRMFKAFGNEEEATGHRANAAQLKADLQRRKLFRAMDVDRRKRLLTGQEMYVGGLRGVARSAGWPKDFFDGVYTYLSQHSHSSPMSFLRWEEHGVNFEAPSDTQLGFSAFALEQALVPLTDSSKRMLELFPDAVSDHSFMDLQPDESPELPCPLGDGI